MFSWLVYVLVHLIRFATHYAGEGSCLGHRGRSEEPARTNLWGRVSVSLEFIPPGKVVGPYFLCLLPYTTQFHKVEIYVCSQMYRKKPGIIPESSGLNLELL